MASPYAGLDVSLRGLAGAGEGFGRAAIGGRDGQLYTVTTLADSGPGSLREACKHKDPLWIVFGVSGTIQLEREPIKVSSYKTIDGRGQDVRLAGQGLHLKSCCHVIVCNLQLNGGRGHDNDGIKVKPGSHKIWIDRCTLEDFDDGLIDITRASTDVTVSRCHFRRHNKTMLVGADPAHVEDRCMRVTIHHCFFDGCTQRHPRVRFGKVHLYNNYTRNWGLYGVCASVESQVLSQSCVYEAGDPKRLKAFEYYTEKAADRDVAESGSLRSEGDLFLRGAQGVMQTPKRVFDVREYYSHYTIEGATQDLASRISTMAGWQKVPLPPDSV
eukprot:jgi/Mesen1/4711/ME000241S03753